MSDDTTEAGGSADHDTKIAESIVGAVGNPISILGLPEPNINALGKVSWLADEPSLPRAIVKAFRSRVMNVHPDRSRIGHLPLANQAYCLLQEARDLLLDEDNRKVQLEAWHIALKNRRPEGWAPARSSSSTALAAGTAERQRLRHAELNQRRAEAIRRTDAEFHKRMVAKTVPAKKRSRPVLNDTALYSSGSESTASESDSDQDADAVAEDDEATRAMAVRARQKQRRKRC